MNKSYLGVDLGSSYTKFVVVGGDGRVQRRELIPTLSRRRDDFENELSNIKSKFEIGHTCSTGYGRDIYRGDMQRTELICASAGVAVLHPVEKTIIDIGGEDLKIIRSGIKGEVEDFHMNDKCSAGTGTFITEIADKAEILISEMNHLARESKSTRTINSFCTVFAKTEILGWKFEGVPVEDIARGIYLSIVDRIGKMPIYGDLPIFLCGGVIAYHPYLGEMLEKEFVSPVSTVEYPQYAVALGAAHIARQASKVKAGS